MRRNLVKAASKSAGRIARSALEGFEKDAEIERHQKVRESSETSSKKGGMSLELTESLYFLYFVLFGSHGKISFLLDEKSNLNDDDDEYITAKSPP